MMVARTRQYLADPAFWGWVLGLTTLSRATSYGLRPPPGPSKILVIEQIFPYSAWAALLSVSAVLILASSVRGGRLWIAGVAGHVIGVFCYGSFWASIVLSSIFYGESWTGAGPLFVTALLHLGRLLLITGSRRE